MSTLLEILERCDGRPILHCPGRYVLRGVNPGVGPEVICRDAEFARHEVKTARDAVVVAWLTDWGLISYARADGTWLHTVNTPEGYRRKLAELGIPFAG